MTSGWVSVKDRLPEDNVQVLVFDCRSGVISQAAHFHYHGEPMWDSWDGIDEYADVTHWMPLPELPEQVQL